MTKMKQMFWRDPTRSLEEVQKVNDLERIENDIDEFHETESAFNFLSELSTLIKSYKQSRFLYLHATFGSGKTHLLKLLGLVANKKEKFSVQRDTLVERFEGFQKVYSALKETKVKFIPVFLNLLDRDASQEPPLPLIVYKAIGKEIGYFVQPLWLLEWCKNMEFKHNLWDELQDYTYNGQNFKQAVEDKASLRPWLYQALPNWEQARKAGLKSREDIKESIRKAEKAIKPENFTVKKLVNNIEKMSRYFSKQQEKRVEFLIGLDEIALFIGDERRRFSELEAMINGLREGPNPVIIGTGQWPLDYFQKEFFDKDEEIKWCSKQLKLDSADTEIIVKKRWLQKNDKYKNEINTLIEDIADFNLELNGEIKQTQFSDITSYPFRKFDLWLLRDIIQGLLTQGENSEHDHIQGRALLVLVRSIFTSNNWAEKEIGSLVTWDVLFDVLVENTTYILTWIQDLVNRLEETLSGLISQVSKVIYLLNNSSKVPTTLKNITLLLLKNNSQNYNKLENKVEEAIKELSNLHYIHDEQDKVGNKVYKMLSQEEMSLAEKIERTGVNTNEKRDLLLNWLQQNQYLSNEDVKKEVDFEGERKLPLRVRYSVFQDIHSSKIAPDAVTIRVLITEDKMQKSIKKWQDENSFQESEDFLLVINFSQGLQEKISRTIARKKVLDQETKRYPELESIQQEKERKLKQEVKRNISEATFYDSSGEKRGTFEKDLEREIKRRISHKFPNRKKLATSFQPIDDAKKIRNFFQGGMWPLSSKDADILGINTMKNKLEGGWCQTFLDEFSNQVNLSGKELLEEIEDRNGKYLGTSQEALQALLVTLAIGKKISIKLNGRLLREAQEIGRNLRTKNGLRRLTIKMESPGNPEKQKKLKRLYELIFNSKAKTDEIDVLVQELSKKIREEESIIKKLQKRIAYEFPQNRGLDQMLDIFSLVFNGDRISADDLLGNYQKLLRQAKRFQKAKTLFVDKANEWEKFKQLKEKIVKIYPENLLAERLKEFSRSEELPSWERIDDLMQEAEELRVNKLHQSYYLLSENKLALESSKEIQNNIKKYLENNYSKLEEEIEEIKNKFSFNLEFSKLKKKIEQVREEGKIELNEKSLNKNEFKQEINNLHRGRELNKSYSKEDSLWDSFLETVEELKQKGKAAHEWEARKGGERIPKIEFFKNFIEKADQEEAKRSMVAKENPEIESDFEKFWAEVTDLNRGDIILIDSKEE